MSTTAKVSARQRIESILDDNSFVEIGALVKARSTDFNIKTNDTPSDGVITGYGIVNGKLVYIYSQDASVIGGSVGEMHAKKIVNLYNMAMKTGAPVIGLVDSTGLRLQEAVDGLNAFGEIYLKQAMASGVIPMITAVFGSCGGGLSVVSSMGDFTFMEGEKAELFVNSPNAINENRKEVCDSASAKFQSESGTVDFVGTESEIFEGIRDLVSILPSNNEKADYEEECDEDFLRILLNVRENIFDVLKNRKMNISDRVKTILNYAYDVQDKINNNNVDKVPQSVDNCDFSQSKKCINDIKECVKLCLSLEIMEDSWTGVIENTLGIFDNYDNLSGEFDLYISGREYEYENLLVYFIYRYLLKAVF